MNTLSNKDATISDAVPEFLNQDVPTKILQIYVVLQFSDSTCAREQPSMACILPFRLLRSQTSTPNGRNKKTRYVKQLLDFKKKTHPKNMIDNKIIIQKKTQSTKLQHYHIKLQEFADGAC